MSSPTTPTKPKQRLALFFDGTWNTPEDATNVWRLSLMLAGEGTDGVPQKKFYDQGVGTHWFDHLSGGAFGYGLSENVRAGYCWLMEHYNPGDEVYLFGFSRGAFTARSLAGVIARCGLLRPDAPMSYVQLYERYQKGDNVRPIYFLKYLQSRGETQFDFEERLLLEYCYYQRNFIKMAGVWDTVGSLGIPLCDIPGISSRTLRFHNTHLSKIVQHSYQALALDEQRKPYWAVLWTNFVPTRQDQPPEGPQVDNRFVEQRWFAGAHCNVGGGYRDDLLQQRPLAWLQQKALNCGLAFRSYAVVNDADYDIRPRDSYDEFLRGCWKLIRVIPLCRRYHRPVMAPPVQKQAADGTSGCVETVNERIDLSVFHRCQRDRTYRPANLLDWAGRAGIEFEKLLVSPEQFPQLYTPVTKPGIEPRCSRAGANVPGVGPGTDLPQPQSQNPPHG